MKNDSSMIGGGIALIVLIAVAAGFTLVPGCIDQQNAAKLCRQMCGQILSEAKADPLEYGTYEADLDVLDPWGNQLISALAVAELSNSVAVQSGGKDGLFGTDDDIMANRNDVHVRKSIIKGITSGTHAAGKGLTSGIIEGLGEASDAAVTKAKAGFTKTKGKFMSRFKRKEKKETDDG